MIDSFIEGAIPGIITCIIIGTYKIGRWIISHISSAVRDWIYKKRYPIQSATLPFSALNFANILDIRGIGKCVYQGKQDGKFCIEAIQGKPFNGKATAYVDSHYLESDCDAISNKRVIKWQRQCFHSPF